MKGLSDVINSYSFPFRLSCFGLVIRCELINQPDSKPVIQTDTLTPCTCIKRMGVMKQLIVLLV